MPPSPAASSLSLAARFAFKPAAEAAVGGSVSPSRAGTKRRLSASASTSSPTRSSPRRSTTITANTTTTTLSQLDVKGKGKQSISNTSTIGEHAGNKSTTTSVDLKDDVVVDDDDDGLDWEISDAELASIPDQVLNSSSAGKNKKARLDDGGIIPSSSPVKAATISKTSSTTTKTTSTTKPTHSINNKTLENGVMTSNATTNNATTSSSPSSSPMPNEIAQTFYDALHDTLKEGKGGPLSHRQLLELECRTMDPSWFKELKKEFRKPYFTELKRFLWTEGVRSPPEISKNIFPPAEEIYSWSRFTPLDKVRVVILGQDPYHNNGQAHGLAFSVRSNVPVPPSLKNIYKEIKNDYPEFVAPRHGYLGSWARQGVLMLNTSLSVRAHQANSHSNKGWEEFTDSILKVIASKSGPGVVFLAWGNPAQKRTANIITSAAQIAKRKGATNDEVEKIKTKHLILKSVHPSPLSANRGFFGNHHFKKTNEWLKENYGEEAMIDWCRLEPEDVKI